jgi:tetratricopeptide (TPR) repeat protein
LLGALCFTSAARAQNGQSNFRRPFEIRIPVAVPQYGRAPVSPLPSDIQARLDRARMIRGSGRPEAARDTVQKLLASVPHHPMLLIELAAAEEDRRAWRSVESLAKSERAFAKDSLLLAQDLTLALERLGRPKDAAAVVLQAWVAEPMVGTWAEGWLDSLARLEPKGVRELAQKTALGQPGRDDLARGAAWVQWVTGDKTAALHTLASTEVEGRTPARWSFAEELVQHGTGPDSAAAVDVLLDLAGDHPRNEAYRLPAARRAWGIATSLGAPAAVAERLSRALKDIPADRWGAELTVPVMRAMREGGNAEATKPLLRALGEQGKGIPEIALEHALGVLREGPPERALPELATLADTLAEARFRYAEALFFAGQPDSAAAVYAKVAADPASARAGASLERMYLIEDATPRTALPAYGRLCWEEWRGEPKRALALADTLARSTPHGALWAQVSMSQARLEEALGDGKAALPPLLAVAEQLPDDRLAPLARQRAGDIYRVWYKDDAKALAQYEECLARYPKAWNTPEVRRWVEILRRDRGF